MGAASQETDLILGGEFPRPSREQWRVLVDQVLRRGIADPTAAALDARFEKVLVSRTYDGLEVGPLYDAEAPVSDPGLPGQAPFIRGRNAAGAVHGGWDVCQRVEVGAEGRVPGGVAAELEGGASSIWIGLQQAPAIDAPVLGRVLEGVLLDLVGVRLDAAERTSEATDALAAVWADQGVGASDATAGLGFDPIGWAAGSGRLGADLERAMDGALAATRRFSTTHPLVRAFLADGALFQQAGASDAEELGCALAVGVAYLRHMTDSGLSVDGSLGQIEVRHSATADQFATIAKLRAGRRLWSRVADVVGAHAAVPPQHAVTSPAMLSVYDPWVNLLRTSVACFGAGVGGADAVTVLPFDTFSAGPASSDLGRRLARNIQSLLLEEVHLGRVIDLAGGSWYVESLTDALARSGWAWFQEIEAAGGIEEALRSGLVQDRLAASWKARSDRLATGADPITGVSEFPDVAEPAPANTSELPVSSPGSASTSQGALAVRRFPAGFEELRARTDRHVAAGGSRPTVFLATLGPPSAFTARLTFAQNLFAIAGIDAVTSSGDDSPEALEAGFRSSGASLACVCSSDAVYEAKASEAAQALRRAAAGRVYLAGRPGEHRRAREEAGVEEFVFLGVNRVEVLGRALDKAGVA